MMTINNCGQPVRNLFIDKRSKDWNQELRQRKCGEVTDNSAVSMHMPDSSY